MPMIGSRNVRLPSRSTKLTPFRKMPLKYERVGKEREYARFYGLFETHDGRRKRFTFQVRMDDIKSPRAKYILVKGTCIKIKKGQIPVHEQGQVFDSFGDLWHRAPWISVKQIEHYRVGTQYEK